MSGTTLDTNGGATKKCDSIVNKGRFRGKGRSIDLDSKTSPVIMNIDDIIKLIKACREAGVSKVSTDFIQCEFSETSLIANSVSPVSPVKEKSAQQVDWDVLMASDPVAFEAKIRELT